MTDKHWGASATSFGRGQFRAELYTIGGRMTDKLAEEVLGGLNQFLLPNPAVQEGIDLEIPSWLVRDAVKALETTAALEQRVEELKGLMNEVVVGDWFIQNDPEFEARWNKALAEEDASV